MSATSPARPTAGNRSVTASAATQRCLMLSRSEGEGDLQGGGAEAGAGIGRVPAQLHLHCRRGPGIRAEPRDVPAQVRRGRIVGIVGPSIEAFEAVIRRQPAEAMRRLDVEAGGPELTPGPSFFAMPQ